MWSGSYLYRAGWEKMKEVTDGRTENESQGENRPEDDKGWAGGRKPGR